MDSRPSTHGIQSMRRFPINTIQLDKQVEISKKKKKRHAYKDPHNRFFKENLSKPIQGKLLDGFMILEQCQVDLPQEAVRVNLSGKTIVDVAEEDLKYFTNLAYLNASDNQIRLEQLYELSSLSELNLSCNFITHINFPEQPAFRSLTILSLSYNKIPSNLISYFCMFPSLQHLDLSANELYNLPEKLDQLSNLKELNLSHNTFSSDSVVFPASKLFQSLATLPNLRRLNLSYNKLRGFHGDLLEPEDFQALQELDISYNLIEAEENLFYTKNFAQLQCLIITGNPFALQGMTGLLEKELYSSVGANVLNEAPPVPYYLRKPKQPQFKTPYPKLIATVGSDYTSENRVKVFGLEINKQMAPLATQELQLHDQQINEIFPPNQEDKSKDIFTPTRTPAISQIPQDNPEDYVFMTEAPGQHQKQFQSKSSNEKQQINSYDQFLNLARDLLGKQKEYRAPLELQTAYKQLKLQLKHPLTFPQEQNVSKYSGEELEVAQF